MYRMYPGNNYFIWGMLLVMSMCPSILIAQEHSGLQAQGTIPNDFLKDPWEAFTTQQANGTSKSDGRKTRKAKTAFFEENAFYVQELLHSGKVLFNDPVSQYLGQLGQYLLRNQPEARSKIQIYAVKSSSANAFTTNNGIVLVNLGLISRLKNEAQLAFILCHEISHFLMQHPIDVYLKAQKINKENGRIFGNRKLADILLATNTYTKEKEIEADLEGLKLFLQSDYDVNTIAEAFDILAYSNLPENGLTFEASFLDRASVRVPRRYFIPQIDTIPQIPMDDTSPLSTHPSTQKRKDLILAQLSQENLQNKQQSSLLEGTKFQNIRRLSKRAISQIYLQEKAYEEAMYIAYQFLVESPEDYYHRKIFAYSLYVLSKYGNVGRFWDLHTSYEEIPGPAQPIFYLMEHMDDDDRSALALAYCWDLWKMDSSSQENRSMVESILDDFAAYYEMDLTQLPTSGRKFSPFIQRSFAYLLAQADFESFLQAYLQSKLTDSPIPRNTYPNKESIIPRELTSQRRRGFKGGLERVVFVNPDFQYLDERPGKQSPSFISIQQKEKLKEFIIRHAKDLALSFELIDPDSLQADQVDQFNDYVLLNEWYREQISHDELVLVNLFQDDVQYLTEKYSSKAFVWHNTFALTQSRPSKFLILSAGIIIPIILPYSIYYGLTPNHQVLQYTAAYDLSSGQQLIELPSMIRMKDRNDVIDSMVYDWMLQLTAKP